MKGVDYFTLSLLVVLVQLFPLAQPSSVSPVGFSAHFAPAVAVSPLRQVAVPKKPPLPNLFQFIFVQFISLLVYALYRLCKYCYVIGVYMPFVQSFCKFIFDQT